MGFCNAVDGFSCDATTAANEFPKPSGDEVCPETFAKDLVAGLAEASLPHKAKFIDAGHMAKSDGMSTALRGCVDEFLVEFNGGGI